MAKELQVSRGTEEVRPPATRPEIILDAIEGTGRRTEVHPTYLSQFINQLLGCYGAPSCQAAVHPPLTRPRIIFKTWTNGTLHCNVFAHGLSRETSLSTLRFPIKVGNHHL